MSIQYLLDENLPPLYQQQLRRYLPELTLLMVGEPNKLRRIQTTYWLSRKQTVKPSPRHLVTPSVTISQLNVWQLTPPKGTLDPEILLWCEQHNFILVTNNRRSMPVHLSEHLVQNRHIPGIFVLRKKFTLGEIINDLVFIAQAGEPGDYQNRITHIPL